MTFRRPLTVRRFAVVSVLALTALGGCGKHPAAPAAARAKPRPVATTSPTEEAINLLVQGDYEHAEAQYRLALRQAPEDVAVHYGLGAVLSHLERLDEARERFEWVLKHASRDREELVLARQWLAQLPPAESSEPGPGGEVEADSQ